MQRRICRWSTKTKRYSRLTLMRKREGYKKSTKNILLNLHSRGNFKLETTVPRKNRKMINGKSLENKWPKRMQKWSNSDLKTSKKRKSRKRRIKKRKRVRKWRRSKVLPKNFWPDCKSPTKWNNLLLLIGTFIGRDMN